MYIKFTLIFTCIIHSCSSISSVRKQNTVQISNYHVEKGEDIIGEYIYHNGYTGFQFNLNNDFTFSSIIYTDAIDKNYPITGYSGKYEILDSLIYFFFEDIIFSDTTSDDIKERFKNNPSERLQLSQYTSSFSESIIVLIKDHICIIPKWEYQKVLDYYTNKGLDKTINEEDGLFILERYDRKTPNHRIESTPKAVR